MKTKNLQILFLIIGFVFAVFAAVLSFESDLIPSGGIDIAADGGAAGFAILAGLCFISVAITTYKNENK